jgi:hypothetical protein
LAEDVPQQCSYRFRAYRRASLDTALVNGRTLENKKARLGREPRRAFELMR